jgi:hypothetical protein
MLFLPRGNFKQRINWISGYPYNPQAHASCSNGKLRQEL